MTRRRRILLLFGTRPEAIKMAPVIKALKGCPALETIVCSTGQHRQMLQPILDLFEITCDFDLDVMAPGQDLNALFSRTLHRAGALFSRIAADRILVHGDTTTAGAAALAAFHLRMPVAHVEAGLRTRRFHEPWPEEMNRRLVDIVADHLYAPTEDSARNLEAEALGEKHIVVTGNTVIDALLEVDRRLTLEHGLAESLDRKYGFLDERKKLLLITGHRRENFGSAFESICRAIVAIGQRGDTQVVYPVHLNPNVREPVFRIVGNCENVALIEPVGYLDFVYLMRRATLILTDSGGVQEEAPSLGKRVLVMRNTTERPEAVAAGAVEVVGTECDRILFRVSDYLDGRAPLALGTTNPYGDGHAAERIVHALYEEAKNVGSVAVH
jgi:UDP-N-acetylglucosamine 2-epimerase (non-hydrolysing)